MKQKLRVLVAGEDSKEAISVLRELFPQEQDGLELTEVSGVSPLVASVRLVHPDVILLDMALANPDPVQAVRLLHRALPAVPLIVIGDPAEKQAVAACLSVGAMDYLLKGQMDGQAMNRVLRSAIERNTLEGLADLLRDPLTALFIRDGFLTIGARAMEAARVKEGDLVLLCVRVEALEQIRNSFGQSSVNQSLREIAQLLTKCFRSSDVVGRIGESQFAALAVDAVEPTVPVLLQRLQKRLEGLNQNIGPWGPLTVRMNAGFWTATDTRSFSEFLDFVESGLRGAGTPSEEEAAPAKAIPQV